MSATIRRRAATEAIAGVLLAIALVGCTPVDPHTRAVESARASFHGATESIERLLPDLPRDRIRDHIVETGVLGISASLIDADDEEIRAEAYGLQGQSSYVLDAGQEGDIATVLLYVSGYFETGGGWSYHKELVFTCVIVTMDLTQETLGYEGAGCPERMYSFVNLDDEIEFGELSGEEP